MSAFSADSFAAVRFIARTFMPGQLLTCCLRAQMFLDRFLVERGGFALHKADGADGTRGQAVASRRSSRRESAVPCPFTMAIAPSLHAEAQSPQPEQSSSLM